LIYLVQKQTGQLGKKYEDKIKKKDEIDQKTS
jgi:hypothetical protein